MSTDRVTVRIAPTASEFRARHPGALISTFEVDRDTWRHLKALYRFRLQRRQIDPDNVRGLVWFAIKAGQS